MTNWMRFFLVATVLAAVAACGGKAKPAADPTSATCCCTASDGREVVTDTVCDERGGTCDPAETCEATDSSPGDDENGSSDPDDY
jgi:hypothetical protein